jgi:hypothetical protein
VIVNTPTIQEVTGTVRRLILLNRRQISARRGLIVTGPAATGKTTAITQLGRAHELSVRQQHPGDHGRIPVLYVTVPPAATPKMLAVEFARFLGLPITRRSNITDVTNMVCEALCDVGCDLVLVDEIHNISLPTRAGAEVRPVEVLLRANPGDVRLCRDSTWSGSGCLPAPEDDRSPDGSAPSAPGRSLTAARRNASSGKAWSSPWNRDYVYYGTDPGPCWNSTPTCIGALPG